jgi:hypothetical protein
MAKIGEYHCCMGRIIICTIIIAKTAGLELKQNSILNVPFDNKNTPILN